MLVHGGRRIAILQLFDIGRHGKGRDAYKCAISILTPLKETAGLPSAGTVFNDNYF